MRGPQRQVLRRALRIAAVAGASVAAIYALRDRLPSLTDIGGALSGADRTWLGLAVVAEFVSMGMFARQQRRLLRAFGVPISMPRAGAITWSRSAIAISMPAGSALSAGWAFRQFRAIGASRTTAATVMVLSGVVSFLALGGLYVTGLLAGLVGPLTTHSAHSIAALGLGASVAIVLVGLALHHRHAQHRGSPGPARPRHARTPLTVVTRRWPRMASVVARVAQIRDAARDVQGRHWLLAFAAAAVNWLADLGCLVAVARAFDLPVSVAQLGFIYLGVQVVRQIPLTPGGVGVIEASLLAGMLAAGAPEGAAAATVLVYRLLSCWLVIPIGAIAWAGLRRRPAVSGPAGVLADDALPGATVSVDAPVGHSVAEPAVLVGAST